MAALEEAIKAGLDLFADHAGTAAKPLQIQATLANIDRWDRVSADEDAQIDLFGTNLVPGGIPSPCYIAIGFPDKAQTVGLTPWKKEVVNRMYHCVVQYHHPTLVHRTLPAEPPSQRFWSTGVARFFDGLA